MNDNADDELEEGSKKKEQIIKLIPTLDYFQKNYGRSMEGNDQKAVRVFRDYEPAEKVRRLQHELQQIKDEIVADAVMDGVVGKKRKQKYKTYAGWASLMLMWLAAKK